MDEMTFFMETTFWLFVNDMPSIEDCDEATAERLRVIPTAYKYLRRQVRGREGQSVRAEGGPHHQVGVDQAPRGDPGVRAVGVRGVRDHAARGARGHPRDQRQVPGGRQRGRQDTGPLRPRRSGRVRVGEGLQRGREARGHQHELGEPQREVGGLGVQEAAEEDLGTEPVRDPRHAPGRGASRVLKKNMCDTYNMGTETPVGYRLVRVGVRGRVPTLHTRAPEDLTTRQKYDLRYREKHLAPSSTHTIANITGKRGSSVRIIKRPIYQKPNFLTTNCRTFKRTVARRRPILITVCNQNSENGANKT